MLHEPLSDILGKQPDDSPYDKWLIAAAKNYISTDVEQATAKWIHNASMANEYTGRIAMFRQDIFEWVDRMDRSSEVILALCSLIEELRKSKDISEDSNVS